MKTQRMKNRTWILFLAIVALASMAAAFIVRGQPTAAGRTYGMWSAQWMVWIESQGFAPLFEEGDVDCSLGQTGPVWFLAGTGGGFAVRNCTVPQEKRLMYPLFNAWYFNDPPPADQLTVEEKRILLDELLSDSAPGPFNSRACNLHSNIDGEASLYREFATARAQSPPFAFQGDPQAIVDGYWVMLKLEPGDHSVQFGGALCDLDTGDVIFDVDVTYNLTVE